MAENKNPTQEQLKAEADRMSRAREEANRRPPDRSIEDRMLAHVPTTGWHKGVSVWGPP